MVELCIVTEELGRALLCAPYFSTAVLAANAILNAGTEAAEIDACCRTLQAAQRLATLAITELNGNWDPTSDRGRRHPRRGRLPSRWRQKLRRGRPRGRPAGRRCTRPQDCRPIEGLALFTLDANAGGVERRLLESMDPTRKIARIDFHGAHANLLGNLNDGATAIVRTLDQAAIALANEMVGGAQALFDSAVDYAKLRVQFGRTIGSFQAIKHKLRRHAAGRGARQVGRLLRGSSRRGGRPRMAGARQSGQGRGVGNVPAVPRPNVFRFMAASASPGTTTRICGSSAPKAPKSFSASRVTIGSC